MNIEYHVRNVVYHVIELPDGNVYQHTESFEEAAVIAKHLMNAGIILDVEIHCIDIDNNTVISVWRPCYGKIRQIICWEEEII